MGPFLPLSCILLKFYIKPQHSWRPHDRPFVVSYWNSTSNHNSFEIIMVIRRLYLIEILHQTTTYSSPLSLLLRCILLKFYIKPQLLAWLRMSNKRCILLKFYIKPQPFRRHECPSPGCILLKFYIKPQPEIPVTEAVPGCILLKFYIKPQHGGCIGLPPRSCILLKFYIKPQHYKSRWILS